MVTAKKLKDPKRINSFISCHGDRFREEFVGELQQNGEIVLVSTGFVDTQKMIESEAAGASVPEIIARALAGDVSVIRNDGFYADITQMPATYADILNTVNNGKRIFDELDPEIKAKFGYSFDRWFSTMNSEDWYKNMNLVQENQIVEEKKEVEE